MRLFPTSNRSRRAAVRATITSAGLLLLVTACSHLLGSTPSPDITTAKVSAHRLYRASVSPDVVPIPVRRLQSWKLHIETVDGRPIDVATITMNGGMPRHGHGLPTAPRVVRGAGSGDYLVQGVKFNMGGWWVVRFAIASGAGTDTVTFNLSL